MRAKFRNNGSVALCWQPPINDFLKFNFDAAFTYGRTTMACVLQDMHGDIKGVWINHFESPNSYCEETEATIQTLRMTIKLGMDKVVFKGDTLNVIMSLKGLK